VFRREGKVDLRSASLSDGDVTLRPWTGADVRIGTDDVEGLLDESGWTLSQVIPEDDISYIAIINKT
jgi:hypothetical protein